MGLAQTDREALVAKLKLKAEGKLTPEQLARQGGMDGRTPKEIAKDRASYLLDLVVAAPEEYQWASIRPELAALYREADMATIADFVSGQ